VLNVTYTGKTGLTRTIHKSFKANPPFSALKLHINLCEIRCGFQIHMASSNLGGDATANIGGTMDILSSLTAPDELDQSAEANGTDAGAGLHIGLLITEDPSIDPGGVGAITVSSPDVLRLLLSTCLEPSDRGLK
jgi:hypothetical protein